MIVPDMYIFGQSGGKNSTSCPGWSSGNDIALCLLSW